MASEALKIGLRVRFKTKDFLPNGFIKRHVRSYNGDLVGYIVKLDRKAPNQYSYNTDEIFEFNQNELEEE